jgi:hypothetical protein
VYNVPPNTHLWMIEQDRERAMAQRALERAARSAVEPRQGLARGGISGVVRVLLLGARRAPTSVSADRGPAQA